MFNFFFDTANIDYIRKVWDHIEPHFHRSNIVGITTNPNAMHKEGLTSLASWEEHLPKLCALVSELRGDDMGVVYVQLPSCDMTGEEALDWARHISQFTDGTTPLGLKIPPYEEILRVIPQLNEIMETNVTGCADAATALSCFSFKPRYVSLIPGRMEEVGIDAEKHLLLANQRPNHMSEIISGSMRTIDGLRTTILADTVPTIGSRVWDQMLAPEFDFDDFRGSLKRKLILFRPINVFVDDRNHKLSEDFFIQMNDLGRTVYEDWLS